MPPGRVKIYYIENEDDKYIGALYAYFLNILVRRSRPSGVA